MAEPFRKRSRRASFSGSDFDLETESRRDPSFSLRRVALSPMRLLEEELGILLRPIVRHGGFLLRSEPRKMGDRETLRARGRRGNVPRPHHVQLLAGRR